MAIIRFKTADHIVFQLVKRRVDTAVDVPSFWEEEAVFAMAVLPSDIDYDYGHRSAIVQTQPNAGWEDKFGSRLPTIRMSGTFGIQPRRVAAEMKDGFTRFIEFRDEIFKQLYKDGENGTGRYVYALNIFDFIHDERFQIAIEAFRPRKSGRRGSNPFEILYSLSLTAIGEPIVAMSKDPLLAVLLAVSDGIDALEGAIDDAVAALKELPIIGDALDIAGGVLAGVDVLATQAEQLGGLASMYSQAISTQAAAISSLADTNDFVGTIKG